MIDQGDCGPEDKRTGVKIKNSAYLNAADFNKKLRIGVAAARFDR
jgi:hypothetical protein